MLRRSLAAALVLGALLPASGCRQIAGVHVRKSAQAECVACVNGSCASEAAACAGSAPCDQRFACEAGCDPDDRGCVAACDVGVTTDFVPLGALSACRASSCAGACGLACGGAVPVTPPSATVACAACVAAKCCDESRACATSADCARATECARGVSAPDVLQYCAEREWPAGARPYAALADCAKSWCQDACAIGADWTCVGSVSVGKANDDRVVGTLTMVDATAQSRPVPGLDVRGCFSTDYTCANPVTPIIATDAMGTVTLSLPASAVTLRAGFIGYFYVTDPSNTYLPEMVFPGNTLTRSGVHERAVASTPAEASMLAALTGHVYDPTHGDVIVTAVDCAGVFAARMSFTIDSTDAETKIIYTYNGFPDVIATDTDATGTAIIGNVPPGAATVRVHSTDLGKDVAVTHILVRAGTVSLVELTPTQ